MLEVLKNLNKLNHRVEGLKVPYDTFHMPEITDYLDIRVDYFLWLSDKTVSRLLFLLIKKKISMINNF